MSRKKEKIVEATTGRVRVDDSNFSIKYSSTEKTRDKGHEPYYAHDV